MYWQNTDHGKKCGDFVFLLYSHPAPLLRQVTGSSILRCQTATSSNSHIAARGTLGHLSPSPRYAQRPASGSPCICTGHYVLPPHVQYLFYCAGLISGFVNFLTLDKEQKDTDDCSDLKLLESGRESPSVIELMMTTVYENTKELHKSTEDYLEEKLQTLEHKATTDGSNETAKKEKPEQKVALNTAKVAAKVTLNASKDSLKVSVLLCSHTSNENLT